MAISEISALNTLQQRANQAAIGNANGISAAANGSSSSARSGSSGAFQSLAQNENQFLTLLTTQLKHQDPTSPMDNQALASELAQFSAVEQQVQTNKNLESLISLNETAQLSQSNQLIGKIATVQSNVIPLQSGKASFSFSQPRGQTVAVSIVDANGKVVKNAVATTTGSRQDWQWDGKDNNGNQLPDGAYGIAVKTADGAGNIYDVNCFVRGQITGVIKGSDGLYIEMGDVTAAMSSIQSEEDPPKATPDDSKNNHSDASKDKVSS